MKYVMFYNTGKKGDMQLGRVKLNIPDPDKLSLEEYRRRLENFVLALNTFNENFKKNKILVIRTIER